MILESSNTKIPYNVSKFKQYPNHFSAYFLLFTIFRMIELHLGNSHFIFLLDEWQVLFDHEHTIIVFTMEFLSIA